MPVRSVTGAPRIPRNKCEKPVLGDDRRRCGSAPAATRADDNPVRSVVGDASPAQTGGCVAATGRVEIPARHVHNSARRSLVALRARLGKIGGARPLLHLEPTRSDDEVVRGRLLGDDARLQAEPPFEERQQHRTGHRGGVSRTTRPVRARGHSGTTGAGSERARQCGHRVVKTTTRSAHVILGVEPPRNRLDRVPLGAHPVWPSANALAVFGGGPVDRAGCYGVHASRRLWIHVPTNRHFLVH